TGIDSTGAHISGKAQLRQGPGTIENLGAVLASGQSTKALLLPLMVLQKVDRNTQPLRTLPVDRITGDYRVESGALHVEKFHVEGPVLELQATGYWQLVSGR